MAVPALTLNILRNPPSLATARIISTVAGLTTPAPWQAMAVGDTKSIVFSICDGQGNLETLTGRTYRVGIGNLNAPCTGGTFTLSDTLGNTTAAQPYNIDADALEDALNAFNDGAGPGNGLVTVEGPDGGPFVVIWNANGSQPLLTANVTDLEPAAVSVIAASQAGSGSQPEIQFIRLLQMPYALQSTWTVSGTTATGLLTLSSQGLYQWLAQKPNGPLFFEIEESDGTSVAKILQAPIIVTGDVVPYTTITGPTIQIGYGLTWLPYCTALTGGVPGPPVTSLDQIATVGLQVLVTAVDFVPSLTGGCQRWQLIAGTTATGPGVQRPADYNASTNAKIWIQIS